MFISSQFDSGNIEVIDSQDPSNVRLKIRKDTHSDFLQWFHFAAYAESGTAHRFQIINAGETTYTKGWESYQAVASYDRETWFRVPASYDGKTLTIEHTPACNLTYYAYFAPYSYERHLDLIAFAQQSPACQVTRLGASVEGRDISLITIGQEGPSKRKCWIIARQHPGETMAEWFMEGLIERLLDEDDALATHLLEKNVFYLVPNMNPDGAVHGNLRSNAAGANLNREWLTPSLEKSPEVYHVRAYMEKTGVDFFLDIHGDEDTPYNFAICCEGIPSYSKQQAMLEEIFKQAYVAITPEFQDRYGYPKEAPGKADLRLASFYVGETYGCMAITIEMPFKDHNDAPNAFTGWSAERSKRLGEDALYPIKAVLQARGS